jgi:hypothetical protein
MRGLPTMFGFLPLLSLLTQPFFPLRAPPKARRTTPTMPLKQQKLSFAGSSSSSDKRPRDEVSPAPSAEQDSSHSQYENAVFMTKTLHGNVQVPSKYITPIFDELERIRSNFSLEIESLKNTIRGHEDNINKLHRQVNELVSRPPPIPTFVEVGKPPVQPHPQQIPPQPRTPRLNKNIPGNISKNGLAACYHYYR